MRWLLSVSLFVCVCASVSGITRISPGQRQTDVSEILQIERMCDSDKSNEFLSTIVHQRKGFPWILMYPCVLSYCSI